MAMPMTRPERVIGTGGQAPPDPFDGGFAGVAAARS